MKKSLLYFSIILFLTGCTQKESPGFSISVQPLNEADYQRIVENRNGKALFVNVWATWCIPCIKEFPELIALAKTYQDKEIEFIGISADFPDEIESKILPFLKKQQVNFPNYVRNFASDEAFINAVNQEWSGALPATIIYDKNGERKVFFMGKKDYAAFQQAIDSVLAL